ncbi:MAG: hypothetical protein HOC23_14695 [Halieaceae bacterium]|nr:hypothetical protein [Halieaceae bacterium]
MKKAGFYILTVVITFGVIEGLGRLAYSIEFGEAYSIGRLTPGIESIGLSQTTPVWMQKQILHPYYGATLPNSFLSMNRAPKNAQNELVLALFGGSVAMENWLALQEQFSQYLQHNNVNKALKFKLFAVPGFKQPQQLIELAYALSTGHRFDVVINLDGYNEAVLAIGENYNRGVYPFYPRLWDLRAQANGALEGTRLDLELLRREVMEVEEWYRSSHIKRTVYSGIFYRLRKRAAEDKMREINAGLLQLRSSSMVQTGPLKKYESTEEVSKAVVDNWVASSVMMSDMARSNGASYYHFLQPNQYLDGSKVLTIKERESALDKEHYRNEYVNLIYPKMRAASSRLEAEGVRFYDMTQIYLGVRKTIYRDVCCHLNELGNELLARTIVERVSSTLAR